MITEIKVQNEVDRPQRLSKVWRRGKRAVPVKRAPVSCGKTSTGPIYTKLESQKVGGSLKCFS